MRAATATAADRPAPTRAPPRPGKRPRPPPAQLGTGASERRRGGPPGREPKLGGAPPPAPPLPTRHLLAYERDGFLLRRRLLDPAYVTGALAPALAAAAEQGALDALRHRLRVLAPHVDGAALATPAAAEAALAAATGGDPPGFRQHFNLHRRVPAVSAALSPLAGVAAQLLGAAADDGGRGGRRRPRGGGGVRLLSTCAFIKQPGDGPTEWHADGRMAPIDGPTVTAWVPTRPVGAGGLDGADSGLCYAAGSHRDVAFLFFYDHLAKAGVDLSGRGYDVVPAPAMAPGDVMFHDGWTLHAAGAQPRGSAPRAALSASFFLDGATLLPPPTGRPRRGRAACAPPRPGARDDEDAEAYAEWLPEAWGRKGGGGGAPAVHDLLPLVWPP